MSRRPSRMLIGANVAVSVGIIAVIAGVSVFRHPASPPTISEFAPANPARQLTAPSNQPVTHAGGPHPSGPLSKPLGATGVPSALQCWSWPDGTTTQTFDRQSPPCIASWDAAAGNGGATSPGVTGSEIRVGIPAASVHAWQPLADFVSHHYQLYGRQIRLVPLGLQRFSTAEGQRVAAASAQEQQVFAALDQPGSDSDTPPDLGVYLDSLASSKVVGVLTGSTQVSTTALSTQAPYGWSVQPPLDALQRDLGAAVCRELSGHRATHAKQTAGQNRRFEALVPAAPGGFDTSTLKAVLDGCHVTVSTVEYDVSDRTGLEQLLNQAKLDAVTSVLLFGGADGLAGSVLPAAQRIAYRPEWLIPGQLQQRDPAVWAKAPADELSGLFGLGGWARPRSRVPAELALHEIAPTATFDDQQRAVYDGLALIAAGVQEAGRRLTPQAFGDGLEATTFSNPGAGQAPDFQARVGFADLDHAMIDDVAQVWWHAGSFCQIGGGRRWTADELPYTDPGLFDLSKGC